MRLDTLLKNSPFWQVGNSSVCLSPVNTRYLVYCCLTAALKASKISPKKRPAANQSEMFSSKKKATPAPAPVTTSSKFDVKAAENLFSSLVQDPDDPDTLYMDGISKLCEGLGLDPASDVRVLVMLWKLGAVSKPGSLTRAEFLSGCQKLQASDIEKLKTLLPSFDPGFMDRSEFRDFYKFVFQFSREGTNKTIEKEIICGLLPIVLDKNRAPHLPHFLQFLEACAHQRITLDQWDSFLQFNAVVKEDLSNLEEDGAWPLLLDEYVEWRKGPAPAAGAKKG